jgi:hypothetical protein
MNVLKVLCSYCGELECQEIKRKAWELESFERGVVR